MSDLILNLQNKFWSIFLSNSYRNILNRWIILEIHNNFNQCDNFKHTCISFNWKNEYPFIGL